MRREKDDVAYLWDMVDAAKAAVEFTQDRSFQDYLSDRLLRHAVERAVEIIGEAARQISDDFRTKHPEIAWAKIIAQRHIAAHEYDRLQDNLIWTVATVHAAEVIRFLEPLIPPPPVTPED